MTSLDQQTQQGQAEQQQTGTEQAQSGMLPGQSPSVGKVPGLPPTALAMQMSSLNDQYEQAQQGATGMQAYGAGLETGGPSFINPMGGNQNLPNTDYARSSLQDMAERLAMGYGLQFGRGSLVDAEGRFMQTPDQLAALQGGAGQNMGLGDVAANMNRIAEAVTQRQVEIQQDKATAALQAGQGLMQNRGRGSLAGLQSNFYAQMAQNYTNPNLLPEQQDFNYWIQKDQMEQEEADLANGGGGAGGAGGAGNNSYGGAPIASNPTYGDRGSTDFGPQGKGDVVTTGPHAGQRPVYTYDPINKTTTISWEDA